MDADLCHFVFSLLQGEIMKIRTDDSVTLLSGCLFADAKTNRQSDTVIFSFIAMR